jgi:hypothetical protein
MARHRILDSFYIYAFAAIGKDTVSARNIRVARGGEELDIRREIPPAVIQVTAMISRVFETMFLATAILNIPDHVRPIDVLNALSGAYNPFGSLATMAAAAGFAAATTPLT